MWTLRFWKDAAERSIKTFAWALLAFLGTNWVGLTHVPWLDALDVSLLAVVVSLVGSFASGFVPTEPTGMVTPSLVSIVPRARHAKPERTTAAP